MNHRLHRSRDDRFIFGVAGGLAEYFGVDPALVRILWVVLAIATAGAGLLLYVAMAFIVPDAGPGEGSPADWSRSRGGYRWPEPGQPTAPSEATTPAAPPTAAPPTAGRPAFIADSAREARGWAREQRHLAREQRRAAGSDGRGAIFAGLVLVLIGAYFLARAYVPDVDVDRGWPVVVIVLGVALLVGAIRRSPGTSA